MVLFSGLLFIKAFSFSLSFRHQHRVANCPSPPQKKKRNKQNMPMTWPIIFLTQDQWFIIHNFSPIYRPRQISLLFSVHFSQRLVAFNSINHRAAVSNLFSLSLGVFLVTNENAFPPVKRNNSVNTYSRISTVPRGNERSE